MNTQSNNTGSRTGRNIAFFLAGGAIGAGAALLFAPKPGAELRGDIAETARTGYDGAVDLVNRVKDESTNFYHTLVEKKDGLLNLAGDTFEETKDRISDAVEAGKEKADEVRASNPASLKEAGRTAGDSTNRTGHAGRRSSNIL